MVGISGLRDRQIDLVKKDNYNVVVFSWPNWEEYFDKYVGMSMWDKDGNVFELRPEFQWQWKQNYPELVVEDIVGELIENPDIVFNLEDDELRDWLYADLLYRGVNKWLFVRYLLIRYKKVVAGMRDMAYNEYHEYEKMRAVLYPMRHKVYDDWGSVNYKVGYWKGFYDAMNRVRGDLKTLCNTPRYVVWNGSRPGFVVDEKISLGWLNLVKKLYDVRFNK